MSVWFIGCRECRKQGFVWVEGNNQRWFSIVYSRVGAGHALLKAAQQGAITAQEAVDMAGTIASFGLPESDPEGQPLPLYVHSDLYNQFPDKVKKWWPNPASQQRGCLSYRNEKS